jgi:glycerophosphoryl diester phosphodiesterase
MTKTLAGMLLLAVVAAMEPVNPFLTLMDKAAAHARAHAAKTPVLSPNDASILDGSVPVKELQARGIKVVPWTTNDPEKMRAVIRTGVDGLISDRPDLLQKVVAEERAGGNKLVGFNVSGHRGARGLRPENTLPAFEAGMDNLIDTIETDTGVTTDHVSLIWHDQFLNPQSCRRADGSEYTMANRVFIRDISMVDAQKMFVCDKLHFGPDQKNDLALSPVAAAFAAKEKLISPYVPTYAEQLFRFAAFYAEYYRSGAGKGTPHAAERAAEGAKVKFNLETKILPEGLPAPMEPNHTVGPQLFVDTLCGAVERAHMASRADVQSFDFRTLVLVEEQYPAIPTYYLTQDAKTLGSPLVPESLRP